MWLKIENLICLRYLLRSTSVENMKLFSNLNFCLSLAHLKLVPCLRLMQKDNIWGTLHLSQNADNIKRLRRWKDVSSWIDIHINIYNIFMYYVYSFIASLNLAFQTFWKWGYLHEIILWSSIFYNKKNTIKGITFIIKMFFFMYYLSHCIDIIASTINYVIHVI